MAASGKSAKSPILVSSSSSSPSLEELDSDLETVPDKSLAYQDEGIALPPLEDIPERNLTYDASTLPMEEEEEKLPPELEEIPEQAPSASYVAPALSRVPSGIASSSSSAPAPVAVPNVYCPSVGPPSIQPVYYLEERHGVRKYNQYELEEGATQDLLQEMATDMCRVCHTNRACFLCEKCQWSHYCSVACGIQEHCDTAKDAQGNPRLHVANDLVSFANLKCFVCGRSATQICRICGTKYLCDDYGNCSWNAWNWEMHLHTKEEFANPVSDQPKPHP